MLKVPLFSRPAVKVRVLTLKKLTAQEGHLTVNLSFLILSLGLHELRNEWEILLTIQSAHVTSIGHSRIFQVLFTLSTAYFVPSQSEFFLRWPSICSNFTFTFQRRSGKERKKLKNVPYAFASGNHTLLQYETGQSPRIDVGRGVTVSF